MPNTTAKRYGSGGTNNRRFDSTYATLMRRFALRKIQTEAELDSAHEVLRELTLRNPDSLTRGEQAYLDVLALVVRDYEAAHHAFGTDTDPRDILRFLVAESRMTMSELGKIVGSQPQASMLLTGARQPSKEQIVRLADHFRVSPALFLPRVEVRKRRSA